MAMHAALQTLTEAFARLQAGELRPHEFSGLARAQTELLAALPPAFTPVLNGLLDRLDSSALFDTESCSFSQQGLHDSLRLWLDKAASRLPPG